VNTGQRTLVAKRPTLAGRTKIIEVWSALDALVLKATAIVVVDHWLPDLSLHCHHLAA
jgi:hypothetical protein